MVFHTIECYIPVKLNEAALHVSSWVYYKYINNERKECIYQTPIRNRGTLISNEETISRSVDGEMELVKYCGTSNKEMELVKYCGTSNKGKVLPLLCLK